MDKDVLIYKAKKILNENSSVSAVGCNTTFIQLDENEVDHAAEEIAELCEEVHKETAKEIFAKLIDLKNPQGIIYTFTNNFRELAKEYGVEVEE